MTENKVDEATDLTKQKPTDAEVLLDYTDVAGYKIRPWTLEKAVKLTPVVEKIGAEFRKRHLSFRDFFGQKTKAKDGAGVDVEIINIDQVFFIIVPLMPEILSITLDVPLEEVNKISPSIAPSIFAVIFQQNFDYLKNWFALIIPLMKKLGPITV